MTERARSSDPLDPGELRQRLCHELARQATTAAGLDRLRRLHAGALRPPPGTAEPGSAPSAGTAPGSPSASPPAPRPILDLQPVADAGRLAFVGSDGTRLHPRAGPLPHRICLLGESAAAGMFHRPHATPAAILSRLLNPGAGAPDRFEVVDLARPALTDRELAGATAAALQLNPSLLVVFAGNNWVWSGLGPDFAGQAAGGVEDCDEAAGALVAQGVPGIRALGERRQRERAGRTLDRLTALAREAAVPLVCVAPEVNLADIDVPHPVYWLPGDGVRLWYGGHRRASLLLAKGDATAAARAAERLIALDGGACAESHALLARAHQALGEPAAALATWRAAADAASWDPRFRRASGVNTVIIGALRDGCRRHALPLVDLPEIFARASAPAPPGRRLFLDHCHLTLEGITLAMAALAPVARRTLEPAAPPLAWCDLARGAQPEVPAAALGLARLQAGLYSANLGYRHGEWIEDLLATALDASPSLGEAVRDYLLARAAPCDPRLTAACRRNQASPVALDPRVWERSDLGGGLLERLCNLLSRRAPNLAAEVVRWWIEHDPLPPDGVELVAPRHWQADGAAWYDADGQSPALFRALAPASTFRFIADARQDLELALTARLPAPEGIPRAGAVTLSVNDQRLASFRLAASWRQRTRLIGRHFLRPGLNSIRLDWPLPVALGDAALVQAAQRLRLGIPADLYPIFGEVFSLRVLGVSAGWRRRSLHPLLCYAAAMSFFRREFRLVSPTTTRPGSCLALTAAILAAAAFALGPPGAAAQGAQAPPPARPLQGLVRDAAFILIVDGARVPVELYKGESAGAIVLLSPRLPSPLVLRAGALAAVDAAKVRKRPDATLDVAADAVLRPRGTFQVIPDGVRFAIDGHQVSVRHQEQPPLLGLRRLDEVTAHDPDYLAGASRYVADPQAVSALRQERRPVTARVYYGSWCSHCRLLVPHAVRLEQLLRGSQIHFEYFGLRNPQTDPAARQAGVTQIPTALVLAGGRELGRLSSDGDWRALEVALRTLLAGRPPAGWASR